MDTAFTCPYEPQAPSYSLVPSLPIDNTCFVVASYHTGLHQALFGGAAAALGSSYFLEWAAACFGLVCRYWDE